MNHVLALALAMVTLAEWGLRIGSAQQVGLGVTIAQPSDRSRVTGTLVVSGRSTGATAVTLLIDGSRQVSVNGVAEWSAVVEPGSIAPGSRRLTARAVDDRGGRAETTISVFVVGPTEGGTRQIECASSVDGARMGAQLFVPDGFDAAKEGPVPLVLHLHGGGGRGTLRQSESELARRRWIGIAPDGREWGLARKGCEWETSAAYVDNPDPDVGPGEQDIFDAIRWVQANYPIDPDRVYLFGFSMGGRGTWGIGLRNPDLFAAIAPMAPASDMYEIFVRRPEPTACKEGMVGGPPGVGPRVDTMYHITSGRFLLENAFNLPVFHAHGLLDTVANNVPSSGIFLHGLHMTLDNGWAGCHVLSFCFGHTPTLSDLHARHPDGYDWAYMFTQVQHTSDPKWISGTPVFPDDQGVEDSQAPGRLLGIMDFFERRRRVSSPDTVVYKTYTDTHQRAYWVNLAITSPWQKIPGAIRARRDRQANSVALELSRAANVTIDLDRAQLSADRVLSLDIDRLVEPTFDPALRMAAAETLAPVVTISGDFSRVTKVQVSVNGSPLPASAVDLSVNGLSIGPLVVTVPLAVRVQATR